MIRNLLMSGLLFLAGSAQAGASIIKFSGGNYGSTTLVVSFKGQINDGAKTGSVTVDYFRREPFGPPSIGSETITGAGYFGGSGPVFDPTVPELTLGISGLNSFELNLYTGGAVVTISDPAIPFERVVPIRFDYSISAVPLPSAASLFGAALLAFGGIGLGVGRRKRAALVQG